MEIFASIVVICATFIILSFTKESREDGILDRLSQVESQLSEVKSRLGVEAILPADFKKLQSHVDALKLKVGLKA